MPFSRALLNIRCLAATSPSRMACSFSRLALVSLAMRVRSGRPTEQSSTLSRHASASSILPMPSSAHAFLNHALWSSGSILIAASAASMASVQYSSLMHAWAKFFSTAKWRSMISLFSPSSAALNLRRASSACIQLACASFQLPCSHSRRPSFLHLVPQFITWASVCVSATLRSCFSSSSFSLVSCSANPFQRTSYSCSIDSAASSPPRSIL
mmetsp:Transcript_87954/g.244068  ORF Transcript_87954/g.244068 Transcript_87954/m.244068 type:complete len:212 (+) Transcript_87954:476-1111(+)